MKTQPSSMKWNDDEPGNEYRIADLDERQAHIQRAVLPPDIEFDSPAFWERIRRMTKAEKLHESQTMTSMLFKEVRSEIKTEHPDWNEKEQRIEFVARMYGPTLAARLRDHQESTPE